MSQQTHLRLLFCERISLHRFIGVQTDSFRVFSLQGDLMIDLFALFDHNALCQLFGSKTYSGELLYSKRKQYS